MPKVMHPNYSTYFDYTHRVQFNPVMDKRSGCYVAVADMDEETAQKFDRAPFRMISDDEWLAMTSAPRAIEPSAPTTGDPLMDQAKAGSSTDTEALKKGKSAPDLLAPPPPPPSH